MNRHLSTSQPPERRQLSKSQREASRLLEGFGSNKSKPIESLGRQDLLELRDKTQSMLNNTTITTTLPDKGSKLKEKLALIDTLLNSPYDNTPESVTDKVSKLSLENNSRPNIRKKSVADANLEACRINLSSNLLQAHSPVGGATRSGDSTTGGFHGTENDDRQKAKVRMISLEESMQLQNHQRDRLKEEGFRKQLRSLKPKNRHDLENDISMTMNRLRLDPGIRVPRPADDNTDDDEGPDEDEDDDEDDDDDDDYNYDSAYEEEEGSIHDDAYVQDDYYGQR